jgi:uncharacterized damage-inducible protein DinB
MTTDGARLAELAVAARRSTLDRLRTVPFGREEWRPTPAALSFADIAHHLREADDWILRKEADPELESMRARAGEAAGSGRQWEDLMESLERSGEARATWLRGLSDDALDQTLVDDRFGGEVTLWWVIARGNLDHEAHHRGQIATYLRLLEF